MLKKLDLKNYLLIFIETFNIWQMGIIFYSSETLTPSHLIEVPVILKYSIIFIITGYIIGMLAIYLFPKKTIILGRIVMLISLICSIALLLPLTSSLFQILYYINIFNCVFFISINTSLIINYYSLKTCLKDVILCSIVSGILITICQNQIIPLSFTQFNYISIICLSLICFAFFKLPLNYNLKLINKNDHIKTPSRKIIIGIIIINLIAALNTLFTASISATVKNGVSISYIGLLISAIGFIYLYKKKNVSPLKIATLYFAMTSFGFLVYTIPVNNIIYVSLLLQGCGYFVLLIVPYFMANLFENYPAKWIAPITILIALIAVFISSGLLEFLRDNPLLLYSIYSFISISITIIYLLTEKSLEFTYLNKKYKYEKLTSREKEVANLLIEGYSATEISKLLYISIYTAKDHIKNVYKKYNVNSKIKFIEKVNKQYD